MITELESKRIILETKLPPKHSNCEKELAERLSVIAFKFLIERQLQDHLASPSKKVKRLANIEAAAKKLLKLLPRESNQSSTFIRPSLIGAVFLNRPKPGGYPDFPPPPDGSYTDWPREKLESVIREISLLAEWSATAKKLEAKNIGRKKGHQENQAILNLIGSLNGAWKDFWGETPGATTGLSGAAGGPYIRFVQAFQSAIKNSIPADELDSTLRHDLSLTPYSIRAYFRAHLEKTGKPGVAKPKKGHQEDEAWQLLSSGIWRNQV